MDILQNLWHVSKLEDKADIRKGATQNSEAPLVINRNTLNFFLLLFINLPQQENQVALHDHLKN